MDALRRCVYALMCIEAISSVDRVIIGLMGFLNKIYFYNEKEIEYFIHFYVFSRHPLVTFESSINVQYE